MKQNMQSYFLIGLTTIILTGLIRLSSSAQTCCSGGVPMAGNVGSMLHSEKGVLQLSYSLDGNYLRTLKQGIETLDDHSRQRTTYSGLLNAYYSISPKLSLEGLFTFIRQERKILQGDFTDFTSTIGLGDMVLIFNYTYLANQRVELRAGAGPKFPTGASNLKNREGITLNADLQPGSGAMDVFLNHMVAFRPEARPTATIVSTIVYRFTGKNKAYLGSQHYSFGNELHIISGITEQNLILNQVMGYGLSLRYRHAAMDNMNGHSLPNTGGNWVFIKPVVSWHINEKTALNASAEIPVYSKIQGTQLTTSLRINAGIYLKFGTSGGSIIFPDND